MEENDIAQAIKGFRAAAKAARAFRAAHAVALGCAAAALVLGGARVVKRVREEE